MYFNVVELIDILFLSSLIHTLIVVAVIYLIYKLVLLKENEKLVAREVESEIKILLENTQNMISKNQTFSGNNVINFEVLKKIMYDAFVSNMVDMSSQISIIDEQNEVYNKPIYEKLRIFFIILGSITAVLIVLYNIGLYKKISYKYYFSELIISIIVAFGFIVLYEYLFVYQFVFKYVDYHIYDIFKNKLYFSDGTKVYI